RLSVLDAPCLESDILIKEVRQAGWSCSGSKAPGLNEALQVLTLEACEKGIFHGLSLYDSGENLSVLQYADDALFFGEYHFIKEKVEKGIVELFFVGTEYQLADMFTKALSEERFKYLVIRLGMRCLTPEELEVLANESA
nr:copia protein [Tanacetum cinerariifolium]